MKKFRAFHKGTMYYSHSDGYPGYLELYDGEWEILIMYDGGDHGERIGVDEKDVEQYIGLKDKNGAGEEVYGGDIIATERFRWVVYFGENKDRPGQWGWCVENLETGGTFFIDSSILSGEIIGNIHENPSLLDADARGETK